MTLVPFVCSLCSALDEVEELVHDFNDGAGRHLLASGLGEKLFERPLCSSLRSSESMPNAVDRGVVRLAVFPVPGFRSARHDESPVAVQETHSVPFCTISQVT